MEILSFEGGSSNSPRKKKSLRVVLGLSVIAGVAVFGSTLAASVTINSGSSNQFQFGQGIVQATACDADITVSATSGFTNAANGTGTFKLDTVTISGIADACDTKKFKIAAYNNTAGSSPLTIAGSDTSIIFTYKKTTMANSDITTPSSGVTQALTAATDNGKVVLSVTSPVLDASTVYKLTLEEQ